MVLIIKKIIAYILILLALSGSGVFAAKPMPTISAESACVLCGGRVLYEKAADRRLPMASTTKLMTAIVALERCGMHERVEITAEDCAVEGSSMYLRPGETLSVGQLLKGLLLVSGNDAAKALARHTAGSEEAFVALMNRKAAQLGLCGTHFVNPHGLSDPQHYSTARDLARLMEYCLQNQSFAEIIALRSASVKGETLVTHNKLLSSYPGCTGGKTGFTEAAGRCLVSSCRRDGMALVCVTLAAPDDWNDHTKLYDLAFSEFEMRDVTTGIRFPVPLVSEGGDQTYAVPETAYSVPVEKTADVTLRASLPWFAIAPVRPGEKAGKVSVSVDGERIGEYDLTYSESVER